MIEALVTLLLVLAGSTVTGAAIAALVGRSKATGLEPVIGLATLFVAGGPIAQLLGIRPAVIAGFLVLIAVVLLGLRKGGFALVPRTPGLWVAAGITVVLLLIPFATNGFWGLLGVGYNNDLGLHLAWAESIRSDYGTDPSAGYPLGPHALVAVISLLPGFGLGNVFIGLIMATGVVAVTTGYAALERLSGGLRVFGAVLVGLTYLMASYYAQAAFKELASAAFILAFVLTLPGALDRASGSDRQTALREAVVPLVLLAGLLAVYSFPGLVIPVVFGMLWLILVRKPSVTARGPSKWALLGAGIIGLLIVLVLTFPGSLGFGSIFYVVAGSDTFGPVSPIEALGTWLSPDYRLRSTIDTPTPGLMATLGLLALVSSLFWWKKRWLSPMTLALAAALAVYLISLPWMGDYSLAKILVLSSPLVMVVILTGLLARPAPLDHRLAIGRTALAWTFIVVASASSLLVLRDAPVGPSDRTDEIGLIARETAGSRVLFGAQDRFGPFKLPESRVSVPLVEYPDPLIVERRKKPFRSKWGESAIDFDSFPSETLDQFDYVVTTSADWNSQAPSSFRQVLRTPSWVLWKRVGDSPPRGTFFEGSMAAVEADCEGPGVEFYRPYAGQAVVMPETQIGRREEWRPAPVIRPNEEVSLPLRLGKGAWNLSLQYFAPYPITLSAPGFRERLDPTLDSLRLANQEVGAIGPFWDAGTIQVKRQGKVEFTVQTPEPGFLQRLTGYDRRVLLGRLVASRDEPRKRVAFSEICGRRVDFFDLNEIPPPGPGSSKPIRD